MARRACCRELEAHAAQMREALQEVWDRCSREHWPRVGEALGSSAGDTLYARLKRLEAERDALAAALRPFEQILADHEQRVAEAARFSHWIPDGDQDVADVELRFAELRRARQALLFAEATPERIAALEEALLHVEAYQHFDRSGTVPKPELLRAVTKDIPKIAADALEAAPGPPTPGAPLVHDEALTDRLTVLKEALREILIRGGHVHEDSADHELAHALCVEIPDIARTALDTDCDDGDPFAGDPDETNPDPDWIPF